MFSCSYAFLSFKSHQLIEVRKKNRKTLLKDPSFLTIYWQTHLKFIVNENVHIFALRERKRERERERESEREGKRERERDDHDEERQKTNRKCNRKSVT